MSLSYSFRIVPNKKQQELIKIDTFFPSSQLCSECGYQNKEIYINQMNHIPIY